MPAVATLDTSSFRGRTLAFVRIRKVFLFFPVFQKSEPLQPFCESWRSSKIHADSFEDVTKSGISKGVCCVPPIVWGDFASFDCRKGSSVGPPEIFVQ